MPDRHDLDYIVPDREQDAIKAATAAVMQLADLLACSPLLGFDGASQGKPMQRLDLIEQAGEPSLGPIRRGLGDPFVGLDRLGERLGRDLIRARFSCCIP